jgi:hypothetical protein
MVDEVIVNTIGLIFGFGTAHVLGNFIESKVKPGVVVVSTSQDKMIAEAANDGPKLALAYGLYSAGKSSSFAKSAVAGTVISTIFDAYWRYGHEGVPYSGYKLVPVETPTSQPVVVPPTGTPAPTTPTTPTSTIPVPTSSTSSGESPGEPDIGLLDSVFISDTDTLEDIMEKGRILEEM